MPPVNFRMIFRMAKKTKKNTQNDIFKKVIIKSTNASDLRQVECIQELWSGYGSIIRYELTAGSVESVVVKHVKYPDKKNHPRGWNTGLSHERKLKSYKVETAWYQKWSKLCGENCYVPKCYAVDTRDNEVLMVFEDLDSTGFSVRKSSVNWEEIKACIFWLANFHATFLGETPDKLWKIGTYWHLNTRPDELKVLDDIELKKSAGKIDNILNNSKYKTFVHGDAKLANFCFSVDGQRVAAVDFQYVGGGCGMKDLVYFIGSCLYEDDCEKLENELLDYYFMELKKAMGLLNKQVDFDDLEQSWRELFPVAWTDFHRFLKGWSPGHWKINSYSEKVSRKVLAGL